MLNSSLIPSETRCVNSEIVARHDGMVSLLAVVWEKPLYQDILTRCTAGRRGFVEIHGEDAVRVKSPQPRKKK